VASGVPIHLYPNRVQDIDFLATRLKNIHWFIDERCIDKKLPKSFEEQIANIFYYKNLKQLKELIEKRKNILE